MLWFNLCYGLNISLGGARGGGNLYISVHVICRHLIDNAKMVRVLKSKITKSQIVLQWEIRMQKKVYRLDKTESSKNLTA